MVSGRVASSQRRPGGGVLLAVVLAAAALGGAAAADEPPVAIAGGWKVQSAYKKWLGVWRSKYQANNHTVPEVSDIALPKALRGVAPLVIMSEGGAAGGVVSEGMGYSLLVEGVQAAAGDAEGLKNGLALMRAWLGMVQGPGMGVRAGGDGTDASATQVGVWPYGVSAVKAARGRSFGVSGLAMWKYPADLCADKEGGCHGSAADADSDAIMGMIYLASALKHPEDFVDVVLRAVVAFASADLGFPDVYRTLPGGTKLFVPKGGSDWGGVLPTHGPYKTSQVPWCYSPGYFAPGHYRVMRAFAVNNWRPYANAYLPPRLAGTSTTLDDLTEAFDGAVTAGYNILFYSSCDSGSVSNWVGIMSECESPEALHCPGVPWAHTPYVGEAGTCTASGTSFAAYGAEASRAMWRIAIDFLLYPEWATKVPIYDRTGYELEGTVFNAQTYLNRIANQYKSHSQPRSDPVELWKSWDTVRHADELKLTCPGVPFTATANWWAALMSYPTFVGFIAPNSAIPSWEVNQWMDALVGLCDITTMTGKFCDTSYFGAGQEVLSTMILSGAIKKGGPLPPPSRTNADIISDASLPPLFSTGGAASPATGVVVAGMPAASAALYAMLPIAAIGAALLLRRRRAAYEAVSEPIVSDTA